MILIGEFQAFTRTLEAEQIAYTVCGGVADGVRTDKDIELLVLPEDLDRIRAALRSTGGSSLRPGATAWWSSRAGSRSR